MTITSDGRRWFVWRIGMKIRNRRRAFRPMKDWRSYPFTGDLRRESEREGVAAGAVISGHAAEGCQGKVPDRAPAVTLESRLVLRGTAPPLWPPSLSSSSSHRRMQRNRTSTAVVRTFASLMLIFLEPGLLAVVGESVGNGLGNMAKVQGCSECLISRD